MFGDEDGGDEDVRYVVIAVVPDAAAFEESVNGAPEDVAPDLDLIKAPADTVVEFFIYANRGEALRQFNAAADYAGQSASQVEVREA